MALSRFSLGSCCCQKGGPPQYKCGDHCNGGVIRYVRLAPTPGVTNPFSRNLIDWTNELEQGTFPRLPFFKYTSEMTGIEGNCGRSNLYEGNIGRQDVIRWRIRNDQKNTTVLEGYCRSLVPLEESEYGADLPPETVGNEIGEVVGLNLHARPLCLDISTETKTPASSIVEGKFLVAGFDVEPYLRVWIRLSDMSFEEVPISFSPNQPIKKVFVDHFQWSEDNGVIVAMGDDYPYDYIYNVNVGGNITRLSPINQGCGRNFTIVNNQLVVTSQVPGQVFQLDTTDTMEGSPWPRFNYRNPASFNPYVQSNVLFDQTDEFLPSHKEASLTFVGTDSNLYSLYNITPTSNYNYKYDITTHRCDYWQIPSDLVSKKATINGTNYMVQWSNGTAKALSVPDNSIFRESPIYDTSNGLYCGSFFKDDWTWGYTTKAVTYRWENNAWVEYRFDPAANMSDMVPFSIETITDSSDVEHTFCFIGTTNSPHLAIYRLTQILKPDSEWSDPDVPEYETGWEFFQSFNQAVDISQNNYTTTLNVNGTQRLFVWHNDALPFINVYDEISNTFVECKIPENVIGTIEYDNSEWNDTPAGKFIYDITYFNNEYYLTTDSAIYRYIPADGNPDTTPLEHGEWVHTGWVMPKKDGEVKYYQVMPVQTNNESSNMFFLGTIRGDRYWHDLYSLRSTYGTGTDLSTNLHVGYQSLSTNGDNFAGKIMASSFYGYEWRSQPDLLFIADPTSGGKMYRHFPTKDDTYGVVRPIWKEFAIQYRPETRKITDLQLSSPAINGIVKLGTPGATTRRDYAMVEPVGYIDNEGLATPTPTINTEYYRIHTFSHDVSVSVPEADGGQDPRCIFSCLADNKPDAVLFKEVNLINDFNAARSYVYSDSASVTNYYLWGEWCYADKMLFEYRQTGNIFPPNANPTNQITTGTFTYHDEEWKDEYSEIDNITTRFWNSKESPAGEGYLNTNDTKSTFAEYICLQGGNVSSWFTMNNKAIVYDRGFNYAALRKSNHRNIPAVSGVACGQYAFIILDDGPYIKGYKWLPNDGIPHGLPRIGIFQPNNDRGHNHLINLDYGCFKQCDGTTTEWCDPVWKKLKYIPLNMVTWPNRELYNELSYDLDWNTLTDELFINFNGQQILIGLRSSNVTYNTVGRRFNPFNNVRGEFRKYPNISYAIDCLASAGDDTNFTIGQRPINGWRGYSYFDHMIDGVNQNWKWHIGVPIYPVNSNATNWMTPTTVFQRTSNITDGFVDIPYTANIDLPQQTNTTNNPLICPLNDKAIIWRYYNIGGRDADGVARSNNVLAIQCHPTNIEVAYNDISNLKTYAWTIEQLYEMAGGKYIYTDYGTLIQRDYDDPDTPDAYTNVSGLSSPLWNVNNIGIIDTIDSAFSANFQSGAMTSNVSDDGKVYFGRVTAGMAGFSTIAWFEDPYLDTVVTRDDVNKYTNYSYTIKYNTYHLVSGYFEFNINTGNMTWHELYHEQGVPTDGLTFPFSQTTVEASTGFRSRITDRRYYNIGRHWDTTTTITTGSTGSQVSTITPSRRGNPFDDGHVGYSSGDTGYHPDGYFTFNGWIPVDSNDRFDNGELYEEVYSNNPSGNANVIGKTISREIYMAYEKFTEVPDRYTGNEGNFRSKYPVMTVNDCTTDYDNVGAAPGQTPWPPLIYLGWSTASPMPNSTIPGEVAYCRQSTASLDGTDSGSTDLINIR